MRRISIACVLLLLASCAIGPSASNDYEGLGTSQLARTLRYSLFLGERAVDRSVSKLVNTEAILADEEPRPELIRIGFRCKPLPERTCHYDGSARSELSFPDRSRTVRFTTIVHISIQLDSKPLNVVSAITREPY